MFAALIFASPAIFAALPPLARSNVEIQAILQSQETYRILGGGERIDQLIRTENGYLLITAHKELLIDVHYLHSGKIGPGEFELLYHTPVESD